MALPPSLSSSWPRRRADTHKGDYGRVLLIGGSRGMAGSIALAGMTALRAGAGLVTLAVPESVAETVAQFEPSYMTLPLPDDGDGQIGVEAIPVLLERSESVQVVACGPGLGRSRMLDDLVGRLYARVSRPLVCDADALNALADRPRNLLVSAGERIVTPHPGEFARLAPNAPDDRPDAASTVAAEYGIVVVLKGNRTVVSDGEQVYVNQTGNPGMATGGTGDVLTGLIAGLVAQGLSGWHAACLGVYLHGVAGDVAAAELGETSMIASDLPRYLTVAIRKYADHTKPRHGSV